MPNLNDVRLEAFLNAVTSGVLLINPKNQQVVYGNPALAGWLNVDADALVGQKLAELVKLPPKTACPLCRGDSHKTQPKDVFLPVHEASLTVTTPGGYEEMRVKIKHSLLPNGWVLCLLDPFSEDVTLTQAHSDFVSTVSHEFRTPLTSIKGFADTLLRYGENLPNDQRKRFVTIIKDQADRLTRMVENLLSVSKLGAGRVEMSMRPISLRRMVDKVIQNVQGKNNPDRQFVVEISNTLPDIWADTDKLEQVLLNLVDNAVKYSYDASTVTVQAHVLPEDKERVQIRISDQGVGIPEDHLPRIFTKFSRIDNPLTRLVEGTGLGLYITKSLTEAMEGRIAVTSQQDVGTTFALDFWIATPERLEAYRKRLDEAAAEEEGASS
ncbi:MAG: ATP-binding protein [Candidatus Melainabacteria bacterium]|nr:ATP-binding protein [Candidatus Melainabacteria bacterium]